MEKKKTVRISFSMTASAVSTICQPLLHMLIKSVTINQLKMHQNPTGGSMQEQKNNNNNNKNSMFNGWLQPQPLFYFI